MKCLKVVKVNKESIFFNNGIELSSDHDQDCCEMHWLSFEDLSIEDFNGLDFDLSGNNFFNRIEDYGIELIPNKGYAVKIPGYGSNNGYYSSDLSLVLMGDEGIIKSYDISECQEWEED